MMNRAAFQIKRPIYPLLAVLASLIILLSGFFSSLDVRVLTGYLIGLAVLYVIFGYGRILWKCALIFAVIGILAATTSLWILHDYPAAAATVGRILLVGMSSITLITTPAILLTRSLTQIGMPRAITLGMLVTVRFVPILRNEVRRVRAAMKTRGANSAWYHVTTIYRAFLVPFMMQLINLSDLLSISLETRGFDLASQEAGVYKTVSFTPRDGIFALVLALLSLGAVIGRVVL